MVYYAGALIYLKIWGENVKHLNLQVKVIIFLIEIPCS